MLSGCWPMSTPQRPAASPPPSTTLWQPKIPPDLPSVPWQASPPIWESPLWKQEAKLTFLHFWSLMFILYRFDLYHIPRVRLCFMGSLRTPESTDLNTNSSPYLWASSISSLISWEKWIICSLMTIYSNILWILDWWFYLQVKLDACKTVKVIFLSNSLFLLIFFHSTTHCSYIGYDTFSWFPF